MDLAAQTLVTLRYELAWWHQAPCLGLLPRLPVTRPAQVAAHLDGAALAGLLGPQCSPPCASALH